MSEELEKALRKVRDICNDFDISNEASVLMIDELCAAVLSRYDSPAERKVREAKERIITRVLECRLFWDNCTKMAKDLDVVAARRQRDGERKESDATRA